MNNYRKFLFCLTFLLSFVALSVMAAEVEVDKYGISVKGADTSKENKSTQVPVKKNLTIHAISHDSLIVRFVQFLENFPFYSSKQIEEDSVVIGNHVENLKNWSDKERYINDKDLRPLLSSLKDSIAYYKAQDSLVISTFFNLYKKGQIADKRTVCGDMKEILAERCSLRESYAIGLESALAEEDKTTLPTTQMSPQIIAVCVVGLLLVLFLFLWYRRARKNEKAATKRETSYSSSSGGDTDAIVIRNTTSTVLRKLNLDDVKDNDEYFKIACADFCADSAVRYIYFKNTCIKDIYGMYADDLRNPENPKEDGCMVLGRWVLDENSHKYDVSLEQIVLPGDDAVFSEYELNFGGKIKLKMSDKLRRLRSETNLQYDLTCWVHSHPGLGVFFSNSDNNVHIQLKHPMHPNFLTAIVVDILTPEQEFGIFTFRDDSTLNSKNDLTKLYSLDTLYKWAVGSIRSSFRAEDHFNTLEHVKSPIAECHSIQLSNGSVIDMGMIIAEAVNGQVALVHGYLQQYDDTTVCVVAKVDKAEVVPDNEVIGCFVVASYCSIPSIRKTIASYLDKVRFVLVYTASDDLLTSIPVVNGDLCDNEDCYGEQKIEDLKIWTRRKR